MFGLSSRLTLAETERRSPSERPSGETATGKHKPTLILITLPGLFAGFYSRVGTGRTAESDIVIHRLRCPVVNVLFEEYGESVET